MTATAELDHLIALLDSLTSAVEYPEQQASMDIVLRDGTAVTVWQSSNDPGWKYATR